MNQEAGGARSKVKARTARRPPGLEGSGFAGYSDGVEICAARVVDGGNPPISLGIKHMPQFALRRPRGFIALAGIAALTAAVVGAQTPEIESGGRAGAGDGGQGEQQQQQQRRKRRRRRRRRRGGPGEGGDSGTSSQPPSA